MRIGRIPKAEGYSHHGEARLIVLVSLSNRAPSQSVADPSQSVVDPSQSVLRVCPKCYGSVPRVFFEPSKFDIFYFYDFFGRGMGRYGVFVVEVGWVGMGGGGGWNTVAIETRTPRQQ